MDISIIGRRIKDNTVINEVTNKEMHKRKKMYKYKCNVCGYKDGEKEEFHIDKYGCPVCANKIKIKGINTIADTAPELIKYFKNKDDAYKYSSQSNKRIEVVCPNCSYEKTIAINNLYLQGFHCSKCNDNISYPEKFMSAFFDDFKIKYIRQLSKNHFDWCDKYKYDFYLPNYNCIVETHGIQHYKEISQHFSISLKQNQENDKIKMRLANENGIVNYYQINCSISTPNYILKNIIKSGLCELLNIDITKTDVKKCHEFATKSILYEICETYNQNPKTSATTISKQFKLGATTVRRYLHKGDELGLCKYNPYEVIKYANQQTAKQRSKKLSIPVEVYDESGESIGIFSATKSIIKYFKEKHSIDLNKSTINGVCNGRYKHHKNYNFKYITKEEYESRPQDQRDLPEEEVII